MNKSKNFIKTFVFAFAFLLTLALTLGITGAWYNTRRQADGVITMSDGIVIDYSGFGQGSGEWQNNSADFLLFATNNEAGPGTTAILNAAGIKAGSSSADFFVRAKLEYKFFTDVEGLTEVTSQIADYSAFVNTPTFAQGWVDSNNGDGWFYYATGSTFNTLPSAEYVNIFTPGQSITLNGAADGFNHQGGGYKYSNEILIKRVTVVLTLNAYQADQTAAANAGWTIAPPDLVQNNSNQVVEINVNEITLGNASGVTKLGTGEAGSLTLNIGSATDLKITVAGDSQINANAFANNTNLENIYIGDESYISALSAKIYTTKPLFKIGTNAFGGCSNLDIYLSSSINYEIYASSLTGVKHVYYDGVLNDSLKNPSVGLIYGTTITVLETPSIVTGGSGAGAINNSEDSYAEYVYTDGSGNRWYFNLGNYIPDYYVSLQQIFSVDNYNGTQAEIKYCEMSSNEPGQTITVPSSITSAELTNVSVVGLFTFNYSLFDRRELITAVVLPNSITNLRAFNGCTNLTSVTIPNSVKTFGGFKDCINLTSVTIPDSVTMIQGDAFDYCASLTSITIPNSVTTIGDSAFSNSGLTSITIPNSVTSMGERVFNRCYSLSSVIIGHSLESIPQASFSECRNLTDITFGNSVTDIGGGTFYNCVGLTSLEIPNSVTSIGNSAFSFCTGLTSITIPNSVTSIGQSAFDGCAGLTSITIPSSVTSIGQSSFDGCTGLTSFSGGSSKYTISADGRCLIENDGANHKLINFAKSGKTGVYTGIPNNVTSIGYAAFNNCLGLTSITIPNSVTSIGEYAFYNCSGLTSLEIPNSVESIGEYALCACIHLTSIAIPSSVTSIGNYAFYLCSGLTTFSGGNSKYTISADGRCLIENDGINHTLITFAGSGAAGAYSNVSSSITSIGNSAFYGCGGLTSIIIPNSVKHIDITAFGSCWNLQTVTFASGRLDDLTIGDSAFANCSSLTTVTFEDTNIDINVTLGNNVFSNCGNLQTITFPNGSIYPA